MEAPHLRPKFTLELPVEPDYALERIRARLDDSEFRECTMSAGRCVDLYVDKSERHLWSPHLSVQVETREGGSLLRGRYAPHPEVWTFFVFLYSVVGFATLIGAGFGFGQWVMGMRPWGFVFVPVGLAVIGLLHLASAAGQRLGNDQMQGLREKLDFLVDGL
jgi:hypothetical protein